MTCNETRLNDIPITAKEETTTVPDTQESPDSTQESLFDPPVVHVIVLDKSACKNSLGQDMKIILDEVKALKQFRLTAQTKLEVMEETIMTTKKDKRLFVDQVLYLINIRANSLKSQSTVWGFFSVFFP